MEEIAKNIFVETDYDEVNVSVIVTPSGVICIDVPSYARDARDWAARMHRLSPYPAQHIILTDCNGDRILNTRWLNAPIIMQQAAAQQLNSYDKKYPQEFLDSLTMRNPHRGRELSSGPVEHTNMSFSSELVMYKHGRDFIFKHVGGPTAGNCWVILPDEKIIFTGDTLMIGLHPHVTARGSLRWIDSLKELKTLIKTHTLVPGRGSGATAAAIDAQINYLQAMRDLVITHIKAGDPRETLNMHVTTLVKQFPVGMHPIEWTRMQINESLGNIYDEVQSKNQIEV